jgi:hypothetical protein
MSCPMYLVLITTATHTRSGGGGWKEQTNKQTNLYLVSVHTHHPQTQMFSAPLRLHSSGCGTTLLSIVFGVTCCFNLPRRAHRSDAGPQKLRDRGGEFRSSSVLNVGARWEWVVNTMPQLLYPQEWPGTHCIGGWVGPEPARMGLEILAPAGLFPDSPVRSELLYRLHYPGPPNAGAVTCILIPNSSHKSPPQSSLQ